VLAGNYGANQLVMRVFNATYQPYVNMASVISPASTYMIMDCGSFQTYPLETVNPNHYGSYNYLPGMGALGVSGTSLTPRFMDDFQSGRHFGGLNVAFADGHVKWLKAATVYSEAKKLTDAGWDIGVAPTHASLQKSSAWNPWIDNSQ
jgi:prepilin-type processing-associated H-X9-DG protein